ncbi:MAG: helix-turn-helix transcriptional regulator [Erysipelotrichaceae bacterium]|nr:helix-turn-helix transcriptional regulator [Erysipelotrichaceae bacterium]
MYNYEENIGKNIRSVREKKGYSQSKLADKCGFSNTVISNYETGKKTPSLYTIAKIARALEVSIDRLYYGDENKAFIEAEPDKGRRIVNAIYYLWSINVINIDDDDYWFNPSTGKEKKSNVLYLLRYGNQIKRLVSSLNDFKKNERTYNNPGQYLELILSSVANEINELDGKTL